MEFPVEKMCKVLEVSRSSYYKWLKNGQKVSASKALLIDRVKAIFESSKQTYGSPRVGIELRNQGYACSDSTVARIMKAASISPRLKKRFKVTTQSNHGLPVAENVLNRNFNVDEIGTAWVSDITYIRVLSSWWYLTTVIDLADRRVIGWSLSDNMTALDTVIAAFNQAIKHRKPKKGFIFHSDRGVQYACTEFKQLLDRHHAIQSMSRKGNCWDNAVAESFFKTIKVECIYKHRFNSPAYAYREIFSYIDGWYNTNRIHTTLGGSPIGLSK